MTDSELQKAILAALYEETAADPFAIFNSGLLVEQAVEDWDQDIEHNEAEYALRILDEESLVEYDPVTGGRGSLSITPRGVEEYNTTNKTFLKTENWYEVLAFLQGLDRQDPGAYWKGEYLRGSLEMDNTAVDRNLWYLKEKGYIEISMRSGDPPYSHIQIARPGRRALEAREEVPEQRVESTDRDSRDPYDVFISHASEDKDDLVRPLAEGLSNEGISVWYDEFELQIGDSLRHSIDRGLANSKYGIVVLSEAYFEKDWTQYELNGLVARDMSDEKVVLPVWYQVNKNDVMNNSPTLADKYALRTDGSDILDVIEELLSVFE